MHVHGGGPAVVRNDLEDIAEAGITIFEFTSCPVSCSDAIQDFFFQGAGNTIDIHKNELVFIRT